MPLASPAAAQRCAPVTYETNSPFGRFSTMPAVRVATQADCAAILRLASRLEQSTVVDNLGLCYVDMLPGGPTCR
jgi:hypothetical protein